MLSPYRQSAVRQLLSLGNQFSRRVSRTRLDSIAPQFYLAVRHFKPPPRSQDTYSEVPSHTGEHRFNKKEHQKTKEQVNADNLRYSNEEESEDGNWDSKDEDSEMNKLGNKWESEIDTKDFDWDTLLTKIKIPSHEDVAPHPDAEKEDEKLKRASDALLNEERKQEARSRELDPSIEHNNWASFEKREEIRRKLGEKPRVTFQPRPDRVLIPVEGTIHDYCGLLGTNVDKLTSQLIKMGMTDVSRTSIINQELGYVLAEEAKIPDILLERPFEDLVPRRPTEEQRMELPIRPPIICVMGHVDHGKTTLIDYLRKSNRAAGEAGGITQSIGAFPASLPDGTTYSQFTMIDTPGHAAFTAMRERGAQVVDAVILVVSATDGVENQTKESIGIIRKWGVPFVVAINKCDKDGANPEKIREGLLSVGVLESEVDMCEISAKTGIGMDDLLIATELVSESANPRTEATGRAELVVLEATQSKKEGTIIHAIVQAGCLKANSYAMIGEDYARVARLTDYRGDDLQEAGPSTPVRFKASFKHLPSGGAELITAVDLDHAKQVAKYRRKKRQKQIWETDMLNFSKEDHINQRDLKNKVRSKVLMEKIVEHLDEELVDPEDDSSEEKIMSRRAQKKKMKEETVVHQSKLSELMEKDIDEIRDEELLFKIKGIKVADWYKASPELRQRRRDALQREARGQDEASNLIHVLVKADGTGPIEAVTEFVKQIKVPHDELEINVVPLDVGAITDQDIFEFDHPRTVMLGFNVSGPRDPELTHLKVITNEIIFQIIEQLVAHLEGLLKPDWHYHVLGVARVQKVFTINKRSKHERRIAGCFVETGKLLKDKNFRVERDGVEIHTQGAMKTMKNFKEDTLEITMGKECGLGLDFDLCIEGDRIECIEWESIKKRIPLPEVGLREDLQRCLFEGKDYIPAPRYENSFQLHVHAEARTFSK